MKNSTVLKIIYGIIAISFFLATASATYITGFPELIEVKETPLDFSFAIHNDTGVKRQVSIEYFLPGRYDVLKSSEFILPGKSEEYSIRLFPSAELEGQTYLASLTIDVEGDVFEKELFVNYLQDDSCTIEILDTNYTENYLEVFAKNLSYKPKSIKVNKTNNFSSEPKVFDFLPFEEKKLLIEINKNKDLPKPGAEISAEFFCNEKVLVARAIVPEKNNQGITSGLFSLPDVFNFNFGFLLNVFLALIAGVLLLVFVARFTKLVVKK